MTMTSDRTVPQAERIGLLTRIWPWTAIRRVRREAGALTRRVDAVEGHVKLLQARVDVLAGQAASAAGVTSRVSAQRSDDQALHQVVSRRYRQFLDQDLMEALHWASGLGSRAADADQHGVLAETARDICACLFALPVVSREGLYGLLALWGNADEGIAENLVETARQLRMKTASVPASPWHFSYVAGVHLDSSYQEPWDRCEPDAPVRWVVTPAYMAEGLAAVKQRVYTQR